ncbi:MAG TPA: class A beta-lactamase, partial [Pseudonocardia sp.]|nr:class A beta-lactamase [Pseudonocardia sp.]
RPDAGFTPSRRTVLAAALAGLGAVVAGCTAPSVPGPTAPTAPTASRRAQDQLAGLERGFRGRIGLHAIDTATGATVSHRGDERFLMCSTEKVFASSAVLHLRLTRPGLLDQRIRFDRATLVSYSPVTSAHLTDGLTVAELCGAALTRSDNTAMNLLLGVTGGPSKVTDYLRGLGDPGTRLDRTEPELNVTTPGDVRDTSTPGQVAHDLNQLLLGSWLDPEGRALLTGWMVANQTGNDQIRAGVPAGSRVADKTGSGAQGECNDIGVIWPPGRAPLVVAVYTAPTDPSSPARTGHAAIASATRVALDALTDGA